MSVSGDHPKDATKITGPLSIKFEWTPELVKIGTSRGAIHPSIGPLEISNGLAECNLKYRPGMILPDPADTRECLKWVGLSDQKIIEVEHKFNDLFPEYQEPKCGYDEKYQAYGRGYNEIRFPLIDRMLKLFIQGMHDDHKEFEYTHILALTMTIARDIRSITTRQMTKPVPKETCNGLTLYKKTLGIIGMGNIGRTVAEIFRGAFDAEIIAYDVFMPDNAWPHLDHKRVQDIQEVIKNADILSVHVPLTNETRDLISYKEIQSMKQNAILINAARGGIVNEADLTKALSEGHLWGAGLDCHEHEPPSFEKYGPLWENLNVVSTPHIGAATRQAQTASAMAAVNNLYEYLMSL
ncbi:hypothetical protein N7493_001900 [Penicillium malachiteum]|uniref:D-isomer specific 2-hydroxyacid dehydrogenase NAD-binding domain-containing protein n=1 Tax=Penicillium malachiteum TaxID=1324776 RepID=A0AAD6HV08_9EURO|nr:hypothetical protein N7493_001900 [Penicillium malachiteum]